MEVNNSIENSLLEYKNILNEILIDLKTIKESLTQSAKNSDERLFYLNFSDSASHREQLETLLEKIGRAHV